MPKQHYPEPLDPHVHKIVSRFDENRREPFEERAAIVQYDGHVDRVQAERLACLDILANDSLLCPVHLLRVHIAESTDWVLTTDVTWASARLRAAGANLIVEVSVDDTVRRQFGDLAVLGSAPW